MKKRILVVTLGSLGLSGVGFAQIPDLLNTLDAGSRSMGAGGAFGVTSADTFSILANPAGLGYISTRTTNLAFRNMPRSQTQLFGDIANPTFTTTGKGGKNNLSEFGYAVPMAKGGTFGFSYQVGGYIDDFRSGQNVTIGGFNNATYQEQIRAKTDFYTLAIGHSNSAGDKSTGWGLAIANLNLYDKQLGFLPGNPQTTLIDSTNQSSTWGVGLIFGFQSVPSSQPNTTIGGSIRTPIKLSSNSFSSPLYDVLPGQATFGIATRKDNFRGKNDFIVYGAQGSYYFGGKGSGFFDRKGQFVFGVGAEYNLVRDEFTVPIRVGFSNNGSGGSAFGDRNSFTYGIGYKPNGQPWGIDLNYGSPSGGGRDFAVLFSYRFDK